MDRTNETATGYTYGGQQYKKETRTDSQGNTYTVDIPTAISTAQLAPAKPVSTTQANYPDTSNIGATSTAYLDTANQTAQEQADKANQQYSNETSLLATLQKQLGEKTASTVSQYGTKDETTGKSVYDLAAEMRKLSAQASALNIQNQASTLGEINKTTGQNITSTAVQRNIGDVTRENNIKLATIAMQAAITKADYDTAKALADDIVNAKYDKITAEIEAKKTNLEAIKTLNLTPAQQKLAKEQEAAIRKEEKDAEEKRANEKAINTLMVNAQSQGVPSSIYQKAKDVQARGGSEAEVAAALGVYSGDYLSTQIKKAQLAKLGLENKEAYNKLYGTTPDGLRTLSLEENAKFNSTPEAKGIKDATNYARAVADYKAAINTYGTGELFGRGSGALGQAYSALVGATKDYYTLGTLDNGVQKLIALGIPEPSLMGIKSSRVGALDEAIRSAQAKIKTNTDQLLSTSYRDTRELRQLLDGTNEVLMGNLTNEELLSQIPGASASGQNTSTANFFNR